MDDAFDQLTEDAADKMQLRQPAEALKLLAEATRLRPAEHSCHYNAGLCLATLGQWEEAANAYRRALHCNPLHGRTWFKLAWALIPQHKFPEAMACTKMGAHFMPNDMEAHLCIGTAANYYDDNATAIQALRKAQELLRDDPDEEARVSVDVALGGILLRAGQWEEGWRLVEDRWQLRPHAAPDNWKPWQPWVGSPEEMRGKHVLVCAEQGYGDSLQMARYLPMVQKLASWVTVDCPSPLMSLIQTLDWGDVNLDIKQPGVDVDYDIRTSFMSLPYIFGTTLENVPPPAPYIVSPRPTAAPVGLVWHGDARVKDPKAHADDLRRSMPWEAFIPIADTTPCISLQMPDLPDVKNWMDTAAIIAGLDLVITVDTAVAHLAASLGVETWMLARKGGCWRWLSHGDSTVWYPSMKLYRQTALCLWDDVIQRVVADLKVWRDNRCS